MGLSRRPIFGTAIGLLISFRKDGDRIIRGFFITVTHRRIENTDQRMARLLIIAT